jgi:hypothetical protein
MKLFAALLILAIAPILTSATPPTAEAGASMSPATTNRASAHDRHHHRHAGVKHRHHTVPKHHAQPH